MSTSEEGLPSKNSKIGIHKKAKNEKSSKNKKNNSSRSKSKKSKKKKWSKNSRVFKGKILLIEYGINKEKSLRSAKWNGEQNISLKLLLILFVIRSFSAFFHV